MYREGGGDRLIALRETACNISLFPSTFPPEVGELNSERGVLESLETFIWLHIHVLKRLVSCFEYQEAVFLEPVQAH